MYLRDGSIHGSMIEGRVPGLFDAKRTMPVRNMDVIFMKVTAVSCYICSCSD
jgi:hypothetical protein